MIESITLTNFKKIRHLTVEFPPGLTLVTGANYTGKSTLLHGILFALWGPSAVPGGAKRIASRGLPPAKTKAVLRFFHSGRTYVIERSLTSAKLSSEGKLLATGISPVAKELETKIGVSSKFFMHLKVAEQGNTQALLTLGAAELHKVLEHVSGASLVNRVIGKAADMTSAATAALSVLGDAPDLAHKRSFLAENERVLVAADKALAQAEGSVERLEWDHAEAVTELEDATDSNRELELAQQTVAGLQKQLEATQLRWESEQKSLVQAKGPAEKAQALTEAYEQMKARVDLVIRVVSAEERARGELVALQKHEEICLAKLDAAYKATQGLVRPDLETLLQQEAEAKALAAQCGNHYLDLVRAKSDAVCPTCQRPYGEADVDALEGQLQEASVDSDVADELKGVAVWRVKEAYAQKAEYERAEVAFNHAQVRYEEVAGKAQEQKDAWEAAKEVLDTVTADKFATSEELAAAKREAEWARQAIGYANGIEAALLRTTKNLGQLQQALQDAQSRVPASPWVALAPLAEQAHSLAEALAEARTQLSSRQWQQAGARRLAESLRCDLEMAEITAAKIAEQAERQATSAQLAKYLRTNRDRFMSELWNGITSYASGFAAACTGGAIQRVGRTADGTFTFVEEDGCEDEVITASGAQRSIMSLGIQLALDTLLPDTLGALLLDEPTASMDQAHATTLTQALANSNRQVIMVSHRELDASVAQAHVNLG